MPIKVTRSGGTDTSPMNPFVGSVGHTVAIPVPISGLTTAEVDAYGFLKPGVPLTRAGALLDVGDAVYGVTLESIKVAASNSTTDLAAAGSPEVSVGLVGAVNRAIMESNLGRVLTGDEIAGFIEPGCLIKLLA